MLHYGYLVRVVIYASATIGVYARIQLDDWHCGSSEFSRRMSYESITENCDSIMLPVNHCCVVHDVCYTHQLGQEECDKKFCDCTSRAAASRPDCIKLMEASCSLLQLFGFGAYRHSVNYTEPTDLVKYTLNSNSLKDRYTKLYRDCSTVNATTSSCALMFNKCDVSPLECAELLADCLHDAALADGSRSCHEAVRKLSDAAREEARRWWNFPQDMHFLGSNMLKLLMAVCLLALVYYILRLRINSTVDEKPPKYSPV